MHWLPEEIHQAAGHDIRGRQSVREWLDATYDWESMPNVPVRLQMLTHYSQDYGPMFFYGGPFSNFAGGPFTIEYRQPWADDPVRMRYTTVESFYQASKALTQEHHVLIGGKNPGEAKVLGNYIDLRRDWEEEDGRVKYEIMLAGLRSKFTDPFFRDQLLSTGGRYIAEDSPTDYIWGIRDERGGFSGRNLLGIALMQVRSEMTA